MPPAPRARRISYVIAPPTYTVPRLVLPKLGADRHGSTIPLLIPATHEGDKESLVGSLNASNSGNSSSNNDKNGSTAAPSVVVVEHPQHRLGISSLALDTTTRLSGNITPEGILYSGGRDGQVIAHELGAPLKQRTKPYGVNADGKGINRSWEAITGWADSTRDDGDNVDGQSGLEEERDAIPFENAFELDSTAGETTLKLSFRQAIQTHADWINDILLCNFNRTLVSCSSDGTVKAWSPHDPTLAMDPTVIGRHGDYVRCLTHPRHQNWVASGAFDRKVKIWDLSARPHNPIMVLAPPDAANSKNSVYALATDAAGSFIAAGSPERVIRLWDARSGKRTGKLVGHTDNIRSILVSDDGRYILTGSADASIKLWSMASANRCIHTFAHHTESVWSLFSSHPSLSVFYSGDRAGNVCRVDMVGCATLSEGECALLCKEERSTNSIGNEGINKIQVLDDQFVWTATASSTINCYKVPGARSTRIAELAPSPDDTDHETLPVAPVPFMGAATSLGFTMDSMHPSALWSRHRDSFSADREGWIRSESPSSISSPFGASNRSIAKSTSLEHAASQDPSESSIFARTVQTPPGIAHNPATSSAFGIAYRSLIKLSSPVDFASAPFNRNRDPDVSTLYSAASIKSVPVPIRSFTMRTLQQKEQAPRPSNPPQPQQLRSVMRRSMASIEGISFGAAISGSQHSPKHNVTLPLDEAEDAARLEYENRDLAADAQPVRQSPDYVIQGTQGIVRSVVLNDRWHALTVDTVGYVGVWDIARGICVGGYEKGDVEGAMKSGNTTNESGGNQLRWSPKEALDVVQERIEGEALVHAWCTVDSGIGNLIVHVENIRAFDAEIFADEAGYGNEYTFEEDHRLNIGKWVLGNLFAPLVAQEKLMQNQAEAISGEASGETLQSPQGSGRAGINKQGAPNQLNIEARRVRSISEITATQRTPGITSVVSMLPVTPAMIPALPFDALEKVAAATEGPNIPGTPGDERLSSLGPLSPPLGSPTPKVRTRSQTVDESSSGPNHDYFSIKRRGSVSGEVSAGKISPAPGTTAAPSQEGGEEVLTPSVSTPSTSVTPLTTPGASSATNPLKFMGKFKGFVKPKKVGATEAVEPAQTPAASNLPESDKATNAKPQPPTFLQKILSKPLELPPFADVPPIDVNPMTGIIISQASSEAASGWTPVYRGLYSTQSQLEDIECLEQELPNWTLEFLLSNKVGGVVGGGGPPNIQKLNFMVVPWSGGDSKEDLPDLLSKESRLTASRYLRVRKILGYVKDKVESIEKAERRREELRQVDEHETSSVSSKGPRPSSRASQEGSRRSPHSRPPVLPGSSPLQGSVPLGQSHQPHGHHSRPRPTSSSSSRSGTSAYHHSGKHRRPSRATMNDDNTEKRPEDLFELLCHEMVLPNQMTLGAVKHFHWKGGGELVMDYRRKRKRH